MWLILLGKPHNRLCKNAISIFKDLATELSDNVKFGYVDVLEDEGISVAFGEEAEVVPWTFAIIEGRAYKYYALDRKDELLEYFKSEDFAKWKKMRV